MPLRYVDNAQNRRLGRVGQIRGYYVDNAQNQRLGRAGLAYGTSSVSTVQFQKAEMPRETIFGEPLYNAEKRHLGRVGFGTCSQPAVDTVLFQKAGIPIIGEPLRYVDNAENRRLGRVGLIRGYYVDNAQNRRLGCVGLAYGTRFQPAVNNTSPVAPCIHRMPPNENGQCDHEIKTAASPRLGGNPVPKQSRHSIDPSNPPTKPIVSMSSDPPTEPIVSNNHTTARVARQLPLHDNPTTRKLDNDTIKDSLASNASRVVLYQTSAIPKSNPVMEEDSVEEQDFATPTSNTLQAAGDGHSKKYKPGIIPQNEILLTETILGKGKIGTVYSATWLTMTVAFKKFNFQRKSEKWKKTLELETKNLCRLSHSNIVTIYGAVLENENIGIVMEYLPYSLRQAMLRRHISEDEKKCIIKDVSEGLKYLHGLEIVHCNLTSENIILSASNFAKIGNYGPKFTRSEIDSNHCNIGGEVDHRYASPEILHIRPLNIEQLKKCDIYSLGILMYEVLEVKEPYEGLPSDIRNHLANQNSLCHLVLVVSCMSPPMLILSRNCCVGDCDRRPTAEKFQAEWNRVCSDCSVASL